MPLHFIFTGKRFSTFRALVFLFRRMHRSFVRTKVRRRTERLCTFVTSERPLSRVGRLVFLEMYGAGEDLPAFIARMRMTLV